MNRFAPKQRQWKFTVLGQLVLAVGTAFMLLIGVTMLFGDNLRRLFGMSADSLAGSDDVSPSLTRKTMKNFGAPSAGYDAPARQQGPVIAVDPTAFAGKLTAGTFDDNANFLEFLPFANRAPYGAPRIVHHDRLQVHVVDAEGNPVFAAPVELVGSDGQTLQRVRTGADGVAFMYPSWLDARGAATSVRTAQTSKGLREGLSRVTLQNDKPAAAPRALDVAIVLDTTSSMADELSWLQREVEHLSRTLGETHPQVSQRWSLITYRDEGDAYVVRARPLQELAKFHDALLAESAGGGGDIPEALDQALESAARLAWRPGSARVVLHFADASHHPGKEQAVLGALAQLRNDGARVYPVASSGTNGLAEYTLRTEAVLTGGHYLFLTDDSGVGAAHATPEVSCFQVTPLDVALRGAVERELSSTRPDAPAFAELRSGTGRPQRCALEGGRAITQR